MDANHGIKSAGERRDGEEREKGRERREMRGRS